MKIKNWLLARSHLTPLRLILGALSLFILTVLYVLYALLWRLPDEFPELASIAVLLSIILWVLLNIYRRRRTSAIRDVIWLHGIPAGLLLFALGNVFGLENGVISNLLVLLVFSIAAFALLSLAPPYDDGQALKTAYYQSLPLLPVAAVAANAAWSLINIGLVTEQAEIYAAGRPYCIQHQAYRVTRFDQYPPDAPIKSLVELRGRRLRSDFTLNSQGSGPPPDSTFNFHALLTIQNREGVEFRDWSYWHQHFDLISKQTIRSMHLRSACQPSAHFILNLPIL